MSVQNKRIVVTGGSRGIGAEMIKALTQAGAYVASLDVLDEPGRQLAATSGGKATYHHCDISNRAEVDAAFDAAASAMGGIDGLVNAAGIERHVNPQDITDADWERMMAINVTGTFLTNQAAFRHMREHGGRILNFGSDAGLVAYSGAAHYSASKGAVISWTRSVAAAWGRHGITVNSIVPAMWTPMYDEHRAHFSPDELAAHDAFMAGAVAIDGKLGDPARDLAPVILFMLSEGSRYMTGQIISVNGGMNGTR
jgi:NAD(P)-dependent dehydrogenase (short-subunit alcohol dehydrogenase family)